MTTIHFIRHGEVHNPTGILYGRLPRFRLSDNGIRQAQAAANYLKTHPLGAVYHSPMLRARQTARVIAEAQGLKLRQSALLNEIYTPFQGKPYAYMESIRWRMYENIEPPYETPADLLTRIQSFCQQILQKHINETVVAVTHGDIVLHAQLWARGLDLSYENRISVQPYPTHASLSSLTFASAESHPSFDFHVPYEPDSNH